MARDDRMRMLFSVLETISKQSHCARNQISALLTDVDLERIIAFGYNGNAKGWKNSCDSTEVGKCGCIHAEANALVKPRSENPFAIFVTETPCFSCAKLIVNAGIREVYVTRKYRDSDKSIVLFKDLGIFYFQLNEETSTT